MIHLYLVRHGIAIDHEEKGPLSYEARPLTPEGRERFRRAAKAFARLGEQVDALFTSPLVRAVQTAEILAGAIGSLEVGVLHELEPDVPVGELFTEVGKHVEDLQGVALVGHDPQLTAALAAAAGLSPHETMRLDFRKGLDRAHRREGAAEDATRDGAVVDAPQAARAGEGAAAARCERRRRRQGRRARRAEEELITAARRSTRRLPDCRPGRAARTRACRPPPARRWRSPEACRCSTARRRCR